MADVIIYTHPTKNTLSVVHPTDEYSGTMDELAVVTVPAGTPYEVVNSNLVPSDRIFRGAWEASGNPGQPVVTNLAKAQAQAHRMRRKVRQTELSPLDQEALQYLTNPTELNRVEGERQVIRDRYAAIQLAIDNVDNPTALAALVRAEGLETRLGPKDL